MNNIIYNVAPRGEGKTRWLAQQALECCSKDMCVFLYTNNSPLKFRHFLESMFHTSGKICSVHPLDNIRDLPRDAVLLIDDMVESNVNLKDLNDAYYRASKIFVTLTGNTVENN